MPRKKDEDAAAAAQLDIDEVEECPLSLEYADVDVKQIKKGDKRCQKHF